MRRLIVPATLAMVVACSTTVLAHKPSDSYLAIEVHGERILGQWDISLRDLDYAIGLDSDGNGEITWGELRDRHPAVATYALSHLQIESDGKPCSVRPTEHLVDVHSDGAYEVLRFAAECPAAPNDLSIRYSLFFELDPQHRGLLRLTRHGLTSTGVFSPEQRELHFSGEEPDRWRQFLDYFREGVWHIWTGFDHILFLLALLLPALLDRRSGRWRPVTSFWRAFLEVSKVVTAFTAAHSITLSLAVLGLVELPSRLVESAIAASVIVAAFNNLYPLVEKRLWVVAFSFGLIHGLGFANVLRELGLPRDALALSLVAFNLGVEAGQLAIVGVFLPVAYKVRHLWAYPNLAVRAGSICIVAVASAWLFERVLGLNIFF